MASKLEEIRTHYHTFVDDQVLTAKQLNGFIDYLDEQDRLSRVFLTGVGIVCGLAVKEADEKAITITQGVGLTTDGDLLMLQEPVSGVSIKTIAQRQVTFTRYRKFEDTSVHYPFFTRGDAQMELWELLPEGSDNSHPLGELPGLNDKTALLYLESYPNEGDLCSAIDCDNQGVEQVERLRVLLASQKDAAQMAREDTLLSKHFAASSFDELPEPAVPRVILNPGNTAGLEALKQAYQKALNHPGLQKSLVDGVALLYSRFKELLQLEPMKARFDKFPEALKKLAGFTPAAIPDDFQYRYDALKEVVACWNEIRELLFSSREECFPDIRAFPKHLLLGNLNEAGSESPRHRHAFYRSPAVASRKSVLRQCRSLVSRLLSMVENYQVKPGAVRITPSRILPPRGTGTAIPFYYNIGEGEDFLKAWDFSKTETLGHTRNLGYHREKLSKQPHVQEPLSFDIDRFNFFRVEGHQGKEYKEAAAEINAIKEQYGLPFDLKILSLDINKEEFNPGDHECEFEDLNFILQAWTTEQECVLAEASRLFSGFLTDEPGKNRIANQAAKNQALRARASSRETSNNLKMVKEQAPFIKKNNVILDNLFVEENTLGKLMSKALIDTAGGSVNDIIAGARELVKENVDETKWKESPEMQTLVFEQSIELMAYTHVLARQIPGSIMELDMTRITNYKLTLEQLCARVDKLKKEYQSKNLSPELKATLSVLISHLSGICCSAKKLEALQAEIDKRKERILLGLQLSEFIKQHPGLEHRAGVIPGGTFVLVYATTRQRKKGVLTRVAYETSNQVIADFSLPYLCCSGCSPVNFIIQKPSDPLPEDNVDEKDRPKK